MRPADAYFRALNAAFFISLLLPFTGCTTTKTVTVTEVVERRVEVPKSLLSCSPEPIAGTVWITRRSSWLHSPRPGKTVASSFRR